jgi:ornithine cyclodeaminase/alanine dehydrogenase-like protein (mu-crystallin family)
LRAREQASHNGELVHAVETGRLQRDDVSQLGDVLIGTAEGRTSDDDITVFDSTGLAIQDLAIALAAMERADTSSDARALVRTHLNRAGRRCCRVHDRSASSHWSL